jgi:hypothetical protein
MERAGGSAADREDLHVVGGRWGERCVGGVYVELIREIADVVCEEGALAG